MFFNSQVIFADFLTRDNCWTSKDISDSVLSLRIVGKFLGFLEFLPFHFQTNLISEKIMMLSLQAREEVRLILIF